MDDLPNDRSEERRERRRARNEGRLPKPRSKNKPNTCPDCGSSRVVRIAYGLPGPKMMEDAMAGRIVLGGCMISFDDPNWKCIDCGEQIWGEER